jgi:hypothetical protein
MHLHITQLVSAATGPICIEQLRLHPDAPPQYCCTWTWQLVNVFSTSAFLLHVCSFCSTAENLGLRSKYMLRFKINSPRNHPERSWRFGSRQRSCPCPSELLWSIIQQGQSCVCAGSCGQGADDR